MTEMPRHGAARTPQQRLPPARVHGVGAGCLKRRVPFGGWHPFCLTGKYLQVHRMHINIHSYKLLNVHAAEFFERKVTGG